MSEEKKPLITKNFMMHVARGGVKSIPVVGALIEEMIFGTLDGEDRAAESAKLASTLATIQNHLDAQSATLEELLTKTSEQGGFKPEISQEIRQLASAVQNPEAAPTPTSVEASVERLMTRHNISVEEAERNPNAAFQRLEQVTSNVGPAQEMDRMAFLNWLYGLRNDDLDSLILTIPGAGNRITENASVRRRVNELIGWADSSTGPGLTQVYRTAQTVGLFPH